MADAAPVNPAEQQPTQAEISKDAKPGTPATRDAIAARQGPSPAPQSVPEAQRLPIMAPSSAVIIRTSTTAAPRPPEGPLLVTLQRVGNAEETMSCMPIDADDHIASGEWELVPPPPEDKATPPPPQENP